MLIVNKYLSLLRSSDLPSFIQQEVSDLSALEFRFLEKHDPDDYAASIAQQMTNPIPQIGRAHV